MSIYICSTQQICYSCNILTVNNYNGNAIYINSMLLIVEGSTEIHYSCVHELLCWSDWYIDLIDCNGIAIVSNVTGIWFMH